MKTRLLSIVSALALLVANAKAAELVFNFSTNDVPLFDFSQTVETNSDGMHEVFTIELSPRGRVTGNFVADGTSDGYSINMTGQLSGAVSANLPFDFRMSLGLKGTFTIFVGRPLRGTTRMAGVFRLAETGDAMVGQLHGTTCIPGLRCVTQNQPMRMPLTDMSMDGDGAWSLALNTEQTGNRITGTATATLKTERSAAFNVRGSYSPLKKLTTLRLTGTGTGAGTTLQAQLNEAQEIVSLRGRLFGQQISYTAQ